LRQVGGYSPGTPVSSTNKTNCHDITEIVLKVALNTIALTSTLLNIKIILRKLKSSAMFVSIYRIMVIERWIYNENHNLYKLLKMPTLIRYLMLRKVKNMCYAQGMGRHSQEEVYHIIEEDFKAVSNYLGKLLFKLDTV
jgi:hypothetical protein